MVFERHDMRVLVHIDVDTGGACAVREPVVGGRNRDAGYLDPRLFQKQIEAHPRGRTSRTDKR